MVKKHGKEAADGALKTDQDTSVQSATDMLAGNADIRKYNYDEVVLHFLFYLAVGSSAQGFDSVKNFILSMRQIS